MGHNYFKLLSVDYKSSSEPADLKLQTVYIKDATSSFNGFYNATTAATFTKAGCGSGYTGESMQYVVPYGKYHSIVSQPDADLSASNELVNSGQTYVNIYGFCVNTGVSFNLKYGNRPLTASAATATTVYYTDSGTLAFGSTLFNTVSSSTSRSAVGYYADTNTYYQTDSNSAILFTGSTSAITATTYDYYFIGGINNYISCQNANDKSTTLVHYKISDPSPNLLTIVRDSTGTTLVADGWYSDGFDSYQTSGGSIVSIYSCSGI